MTALRWNTGVTGYRSISTNWSPAKTHESGDAFTIDTDGTHTVAIDSSDFAGSLTFDASNATVDDTGRLNLFDTLTLTAGTFQLNGGTISDGTIVGGGGSLVFNVGVLSGVTYDGTLDLAPDVVSSAVTASTVSTDPIVVTRDGPPLQALRWTETPRKLSAPMSPASSTEYRAKG